MDKSSVGESIAVLQLASVRSWLAMFEGMAETYFFVKDSDSRFLYVNQALLDRLRMADPSEIIGTTDYDRYPRDIADALVADDQAVMASGKAVVDKVEALLNEQGILDWYVTSKYPLYDLAGQTLGVAGMVRKHGLTRMTGLANPVLDLVLEQIHDNPAFPHRVGDLAKKAHMSTRQLHRKFSERFGMSLQEFINRTRIQASSADLLDTRDSIGEIAERFGFCNHSAYTRMFRNLTGMSPLQFRSRHARR